MTSISTIRFLLLAVVAAATALAAGAVFAHEQREGEYQWVVGFLAEPAYEGQVNGVYLKLLKQASEAPGEHGNEHEGSGETHDDAGQDND